MSPTPGSASPTSAPSWPGCAPPWLCTRGGFALEALAIPAAPDWRIAAAIVFMVLGTLAAVQAWLSWKATEKSLRRGTPLPGLAVGGILVIGVILAAVLLGIGLYL